MSDLKTLFLPDSLRQQLKQPLGQLVTGSISDCNSAIRTTIQEEEPSKIVLVGDTVSRHAIEAGIHADMIIVDNKEMRQPPFPFHSARGKHSSSSIPRDHCCSLMGGYRRSPQDWK